jgi:hypothetical protein
MQGQPKEELHIQSISKLYLCSGVTGELSKNLERNTFPFNPWLTVTTAKTREHRNNLLVIQEIFRRKVCTVAYRSNTGILVSNSTAGMGVFVCVYVRSV